MSLLRVRNQRCEAEPKGLTTEDHYCVLDPKYLPKANVLKTLVSRVLLLETDGTFKGA